MCVLAHFNANWMETIAPRNAEKHSELKPSSSRCEKKVAKIDRNLENFDILTALNAYICTATTRNRWVQVKKNASRLISKYDAKQTMSGKRYA